MDGQNVWESTRNVSAGKQLMSNAHFYTSLPIYIDVFKHFHIYFSDYFNICCTCDRVLILLILASALHLLINWITQKSSNWKTFQQ